MDFSESLGFAFKGENLPKIMTIVLVSVLSGVSIFVLALLLQNLWVSLLIIPILFAFSFFISGYSISIIKSVMDDDESRLPAIQLGRDIGRGVVVFLASIVYMIPIIILTAIFIGLIAGMGTNTSSDAAGAGILIAFCGGGLVWLGLMFVLGYSLIVGQIRYAAEGSAGALFNLPKNFGVVMSNIGSTLGLFVRWLGIGLVFSIFSSVILNVVSAFFTGVQFEAIEYLSEANYKGLSTLATPLLIFGSIYYIISLTLSIMQSVSLAHLMAGFGIELGYAPNKLKNGEKSSSKGAILVIIAIVVVIGLFACAMIAGLAMLGPQIGEVFSEIIQETSY